MTVQSFTKNMPKNMGLRSEKLDFNSALNFRRVTHFRLCLLGRQVHAAAAVPAQGHRLGTGVHMPHYRDQTIHTRGEKKHRKSPHPHPT